MSLLRDIASIATDVAQFIVKLETKALMAKSIEGEIKRACFWGGLLIACVAVLLAGIGLVIAGACILLATVTGTGAAALIIGVVVTIIAAAIIAAGKSYIR